MPTAAEMESRWQALYAQMENNIAQTGLHINGVFGEGDSPTFCYTAGLTDRGWAEFLLLGVRFESAEVILNALADQYAEQGRRPTAGDVVHGVANVPLRLGSVGLTNYDGLVNQTLARQARVGGPCPDFVHCVLPDSEGRFPLDAGYNARQMWFQRPLSASGHWDYLPAAG